MNFFRLASVLAILLTARRLEWRELENTTGPPSDFGDKTLGQPLPKSAVKVMVAVLPGAATTVDCALYLYIDALSRWVRVNEFSSAFTGITDEGNIERISPAGASAIYIDAEGATVHVGYSIEE